MIDKLHAANIESMLAQIRQYEARASGTASEAGIGVSKAQPGSSGPGFANAVKGALDSVNNLQQRASSLATAFERGEDVPLTDVVLAMQKSSIAFEATLQIRNKVMKAYEDIKNMPV